MGIRKFQSETPHSVAQKLLIGDRSNRRPTSRRLIAPDLTYPAAGHQLQNNGILDLQRDILLSVAQNLSIGDLSNLRSTSLQLYLILTPNFHRLCLQDVGRLTALQWAAARGHGGLVELAIVNGAGIDKPLRSKLDSDVLKLADIIGDRGNLGRIFHLANYGAGTVAKDFILRTPLYLAACLGHLKATEALLATGASMQCFGEMSTPAHVSAYRGDVHCMQAFIGAKFDINTRGLGGATILHAASESGGVDMMRYLFELAGGVKLINTRDSNQQTPLHVAAAQYGLGEESRIKTEFLLQHGADIHAKDKMGNTPAHSAAIAGNVDTMRALIAAGIDFHARNDSGQTILHGALNGEQGMLEYLLGQEGGRGIIHLGDNEGKTPLDDAVRLRESEAVKWLVEYGADRACLVALP